MGIDGAPFDLVKSWAYRGELPNIRTLLNDGAFGELKSVLDITPPAWSSIYTGKNAGQHGIFDFLHHNPGTYDFTPANSSMRDSEDIWETLSAHGLKVGVVNAPLTFPVRAVNGFLISGFLTPGEGVDYTYPVSLKNEIKRIVPDFRPSSANELQLNLNKDAYVENVSQELENLSKVSKYLLEKGDYDFFAVFISETDHVQHWFWENMLLKDGKTKDQEDRYCDVILNTYKTTDRIVGELLEGIDDDTTVILVSDHGGTYLQRFFQANYFLHSIGMLNFKTNFKSTLRQALYDRGITQRLYQFLQSQKLFLLQVLIRPITLSFSDIDWERTSAYSAGYGQIYLNLKGRDPKGIVPQQRFGELRNFIIEKLNKIRDPESGKSPVEAAYRKEEIFSGKHIDEAPDIQLVMSDGYEPFPWAAIADRLFTKRGARSGTHNTHGMIILKGKEIRKGRLEGASVLDVAPTILGIMKVPIPSDYDGKILDNALRPEFIEANPIQFSKTERKETREQYELTEKETEKIEENLRSLGYI
ncbi:MAG: alkaline phosphatase family protein [Nitrososphaerales archaeon]